MDFSMISDFLNSQTGSWALFLSAASAVCAWAATLTARPFGDIRRCLPDPLQGHQLDRGEHRQGQKRR